MVERHTDEPWESGRPPHHAPYDVERRYTLAEAERQLKLRECQTHGHQFETLTIDGTGDPVAVYCGRCSNRWPINRENPDEPPDGYEFTGEWRVARPGEWALDDNGRPYRYQGPGIARRIILRETALPSGVRRR